MRIKSFLLLAVAATLFVACNSNNDLSFNVLHPRYSFSEISMNKSYEGSTVGKDVAFIYKNEVLTTYTNKDYVNATLGYTYTSTQSSNNGTTVAYTATDHSVSYTLTSLGMAEKATRTDAGASTVAHQYLFSYKLIDELFYVTEITHQIKSSGSEEYTTYYVLSFDYSNFASNEILLVQTLFGEEQYRVALTIDRSNANGIPDYQLFEFHPLDKLIEGVYGGFIGTFDYCVTGLTLGDEVRTADVELNLDGDPSFVTVRSSNAKSKTAYYAYTYTTATALQ